MTRALIRTALARPARIAHGQRHRAPLESLAAEFALLAQRRGRVQRQLSLLERQRDAAALTLRQVEQRLLVLSQRMHREGLPVSDPGLSDAAAETASAPVPRPSAIRTRRGLVLEY